MNSLYDTPEGKQSLRMRPACNRVLSEVFNVNSDSIVRYEQEEGPHILDSEFAIDLKVILSCGAQLSGQEKALSHHYYMYRTFTIEFYQNRNTKEPGEFFKIASQFYLSGYSNETGVEFIEWKIIKMFDFMDWLRNAGVQKLEDKCKPSTSRASFLPIPYSKIPNSFIFADGSGPGSTNIFGRLDDILKQKRETRQHKLFQVVK